MRGWPREDGVLNRLPYGKPRPEGQFLTKRAALSGGSLHQQSGMIRCRFAGSPAWIVRIDQIESPVGSRPGPFRCSGCCSGPVVRIARTDLIGPIDLTGCPAARSDSSDNRESRIGYSYEVSMSGPASSRRGMTVAHGQHGVKALGVKMNVMELGARTLPLRPDRLINMRCVPRTSSQSGTTLN